MTGLIKAYAVSALPARAVAAPDQSVEGHELAAAVEHAAALAAVIEGLRGERDQAEQNASIAEEVGFERGLQLGREQGRKIAQEKLDHRLQVLRDAMETALSAFDVSLVEHSQQLAVRMTQVALANLFGDVTSYASLVAQSIAHHLRATAHDAVLSIDVSAQDFPDDKQLRNLLAEYVRTPGCSITARPELEPGACLIGLTLGTSDISLSTQHGKLAATLDNLRGDHA